MKSILFTIFLLPCLLFGIDDFALVSIPKCGTHLLIPVLEEISGLKQRGYDGTTDFDQLKINHQFSVGHNLTKVHFDLINDRNYKVFSIYRDPRDHLISFVFFFKLFPDQYLDISCALKYLTNNLFYEHWYTNFWNMLHTYVSKDNLYMVKFEDLIGSRGGGSDELQIETVIKIAKFIDVDISEEEAIRIIDKIWGHSPTFRKGAIGDWKNYFSPEQVQLYKEKYGQLLIDLGYEKDLNWVGI